MTSAAIKALLAERHYPEGGPFSSEGWLAEIALQLAVHNEREADLLGAIAREAKEPRRADPTRSHDFVGSTGRPGESCQICNWWLGHPIHMPKPREYNLGKHNVQGDPVCWRCDTTAHATYNGLCGKCYEFVLASWLNPETAPNAPFMSNETQTLRKIYDIATRTMANPAGDDAEALALICGEIEETLGTSNVERPAQERTPEANSWICACGFHNFANMWGLCEQCRKSKPEPSPATHRFIPTGEPGDCDFCGEPESAAIHEVKA